MKSGEVSDELYLFRIQMEWDAIVFPSLHVERQAQLFKLWWLLKISVLRMKREKSMHTKPIFQRG
jgi:hypothetical protein